MAEPVPIRAYDFETFWHLWPSHPRKVKKALCRSMFDQITSQAGFQTRNRNKESGQLVDIHLKATPQEIIEGLKRYIKNFDLKSDYSRDFTYLPMPETWLNGGLWDT